MRTHIHIPRFFPENKEYLHKQQLVVTRSVMHCLSSPSHVDDQIKALRRRFAQVDEDGTGVLNRQQFCDMLAGVGIYLTGHEQERVKERCVGCLLYGEANT